MNIVTKRRKLYAEMGFTEFGNGGLFVRERGPREGEEGRRRREKRKTRKSLSKWRRWERHDTLWRSCLVQKSKAQIELHIKISLCHFHSILFVFKNLINQSHTLTNMIKMKTK